MIRDLPRLQSGALMLAWVLVAIEAAAFVVPSGGLFDTSPQLTLALLGGLVAAAAVGTASLARRLRTHSTRPGVVAVVVAGGVCAFGLLGMLTVGMFVMPVGVLLVLAATPLPLTGLTPGVAPPTAPR